MTHTSYTQQIKRLSRRIKALKKTSDSLATYRVSAILIGGGATLYLLFTTYTLVFYLTLLGTVASFSYFLRVHRRVQWTLKQHQIWRDIKQAQRARIVLDWKRIPQRTLEADMHPLETDLDLRTVHRLLDTSVTREGSHRLRQWLIDPPTLATTQARQAVVADLCQRPTYRAKLQYLARLTEEERRKTIDISDLRQWLQSPLTMPPINRSVILLGVLSAVSVPLLIASQFIPALRLWAGLAWGAYALFYLSRISLMNKISDNSQRMVDVLERVIRVMDYIETTNTAQQPNLTRFVAPIVQERPSQVLKRLNRAVGAVNLRGNLILWLAVNALIPWDMFFLRRLQIVRNEMGAQLPRWLAIWYDLEALSSLANYGDLTPQATLPTLHDDPQATVFATLNVGHPLINTGERVTNSFAFNKLGEVVIITGSNMSGKSSFLRTLGVNLAVAYAGGYVLADTFTARTLRLFTAIRITDSLNDGISYFYAEVKRLRALLDELNQGADADHLPLFFLIDEIFKGTNNRERLIGAASYVKEVVGKYGVGFIATHDLELTALSETYPQVTNYHFREHVEDGRMVFDYTLRDGASPTTNALKIMRLEGLPVDEQSVPRT